MTRRLVASYLALAAVVLLALEIPLGVIHGRTERQAFESRIERDAVALASISEDLLERGGPYDDLRVIVDRYAAGTDSRAVIVDRDGTLLVDTDTTRPEGRSFSSRPEIATALTGRPAVGERRSETLGHRIVYVAVPSASGGRVHGAVRVSVSAGELDDRVLRYRLALVGIAAVVLAAVAVIGWLLARSVARPLEDLGATASRAGDGDLTVRAHEDRGPAEVRELARRFNVSTARLEALLASHRDFVADASHQLRTPLTALRLRLENLESDIPPGGREDLDGALGEADRLGRLVEGLLTLVRADRAEGAPVATEVGEAVRERVAAWTPLAEEESVRMELDAPQGSVRARAVAGSVEQILDNLLDNALLASGAHGEVRVGMAREDGWVVITVADRGPGMTPQQIASAFERFWTTRGREGSGLGLAIVERLARASGGTATLRARDGGGLVAEVRLPAA
ncbi:MAG: HAMP domain-containing protein [Thermoleophilia bacterium]|nr:HAMP domain-containing protein [Thermoleophilia bacterium]